jgi:hypothetical protein
MAKKKFFRLVYTAIVVLLTSTFFISSCTVPVGVDKGIAGITPTPVTPSATPLVCPPQDITSQDDLEISSTFLVVLFDQSSVENNTLEYSDGKKTGNVVEFINDFIPKIMGPGDQYSIFKMGYINYDDALFYRYSSKVSKAPKIVTPPAQYNTLTPVPSPTPFPGGSVMKNLADQNMYEATVTAQVATATQLAFEYQCHVNAFDSDAQATATGWSVTKTAVATEISSQLQNASTPSVSISPTPFADTVYEGLLDASVDFENQCSGYHRCILLIFDDMHDWRNTAPGEKVPFSNISLGNVDVISVMSNCPVIFSPTCTQVQGLWTDQLKRFGAKSVTYINGSNLEDTLIQDLGDKNQ